MSAVNFCTVTASTKRNADLGSGRIGAPATNLASLLVTPLWPVSQEVIQRLELDTPRTVKECYHIPATPATALPDVLEDDVLTHGGTDYRVIFAEEWPEITQGNVPSLRIVVDEIMGT